MTPTGANYIISQLEKIGVTKIFGVPGAHIDALFAATIDTSIKATINCHELSAAYMADGYSRATNNLGVVATIGGPGAQNLVTAITTAKLEKSPMLVITGDVPSTHTHVPGFQCSSSIGSNDDAVFKVVAKSSKRVSSSATLKHDVIQAIKDAFTPPFGPSHLIIPQDILAAPFKEKAEDLNIHNYVFWNDDDSQHIVSRLSELLLSDKKLIFWIGSTLNRSYMSEAITHLAETFNVPIVTSYSGKGVIDETHPLALGNFGYAGSNASNALLRSDSPDAIIGFDIEMNERNSFNWSEALFSNKTLLLVNYPNSYENKSFAEHYANNPFYILDALNKNLKDTKYSSVTRRKWVEHAIKPPSKLMDIPQNNEAIEPAKLILVLNDIAPKDVVLFVDSGNHRVFPGMYYKSKKAASFYSAETTAPLGWAIAASIGAKFERKEPMILFTGDGCMQMHGIELKTAVKHQLPILIILNNNKAYGSVYKRMHKISDETASLAEINEVDWSAFVKSLGVSVIDITSLHDFKSHVEAFFDHQKLMVLNVATPKYPYVHDINLVKAAFV